MQQALDAKAVIILGMRHSGTSAMAEVLAKAGINFGDRLLPAEMGENTKGFWEHQDIVALHDRVLLSLGSAWDDIKPLEGEWWEKSFLGKFRHDLRAILERDFSHTSHWGVKDSRLCRLLPLWQSALEETGCQVRHVLILRHPVEVAQSLYVRNGMPELRASLLWLEHTMAAERHTRGLPRVWLRYEDMLSGWRQAIVSLLEDPDGGLHLTPDAEREIDAFLDQHLRHHRERETQAPASAPLRLAQDLYDHLPSLLRDGQVEEGFAAAAKQLEQCRREMAPWLNCLHGDSMNCRRELDMSQRELSGQIAGMEREIARIKSSLTWKIGMPLRLAQNLMRSPQQILSEVVGRLGISPQEHGLGSLPGKSSGEKTFASPALVRVEMPPSPELLDTLVLPCPVSPVASIIVPVFNQLQLTLECLLSLANSASRHDFEVIVIDDASRDDTSELLPRLRGLRYLRNSANLGYAGACNRAAIEALGRYLVFLNNDTQVQPSWLDALLAVFEKHPEAGIAGSKLLNPDGSLQEAGAELTAEAYAILRGEGGDPDAAAYNTLQEVTYVSGASLMIKASLFRTLGGFDEVYSPAYYEDSDLAMRVRQAGHRIYYQPESVAVHHRSATTGHIPVTVANLSLRNRLIFLARWGGELSARTAPCGRE